MGVFSLSEASHRRLRRFRRRTWLLIMLSLFARAADAALGLGLIESDDQLAARAIVPSPLHQEHRP